MQSLIAGRKSGGLKASDPLIEFVQNALEEDCGSDHDDGGRKTGTVAYGHSLREIFRRIEPLTHPSRCSEMRELIPGVGRFHASLPLVDALQEYDSYTRLTQRRFVPPTFREIRHILNVAAIEATVRGEDSVRLVTLDADETIYSDGGTVSHDSPMIPLISRLLTSGVRVSLVTAAGYSDASRYEQRLGGLLRAFELAIELGADPCFLDRFFVMGGEANYFLVTELDGRRRGDGTKASDCKSSSEAAGTSKSTGAGETEGRTASEVQTAGRNEYPVAGPFSQLRVRFRMVPPEEWKDGRGVRWPHEKVGDLLDKAEACLVETATRLGLDVRVIRKERAVGIVRADESEGSRLPYEVLEEISLATQHALRGHEVPHCVFNGGADAFVDVGHKALGIRAVQAYAEAAPRSTLHFGDRFTRTGNDRKARAVASGVWVADPSETELFLKLLIQKLRDKAMGKSKAKVLSPGSVDSAAASNPSAGPTSQGEEGAADGGDEYGDESPPAVSSQRDAGVRRGMSIATRQMLRATRTAAMERSDWESAGGKVVGHVRSGSASPVSEGGASGADLEVRMALDRCLSTGDDELKPRTRRTDE